MQGKRVADDSDGVLNPGEYARRGGVWHGRAPNGLLANLGAHSVTEHDDGTITVSPSILVKGGENNESWHGFLEAGIWRQC